MSKTRNERRLRRSRAIGSAVFTVCILLPCSQTAGWRLSYDPHQIAKRL